MRVVPAAWVTPVVVVLQACHFGFCFGVENAIEIAYRTLEENPGRRILLLSEMISIITAGLVFLSLNALMVRQMRRITQEDQVTREVIGTRCERGAEIARMLELPEATQAAIRALDEHWDGRGQPRDLLEWVDHDARDASD